MSSPGAGLLRVARGGLLACCCTALALLGHVDGGGAPPPLPLLVAVTLLVGSALTILADRRRQFREILVAALGAQVVFHVAFSLAAAPGAARHGAHLGTRLLPDSATLLPVHLAFPVPDGAAMVAGHVLAAAATAVLVSRGEDVVWALFHLFGLVLMPTVARVAVVDTPTSPPVWAWVPARGEAASVRVHPRRGPPRVAAA